MENIEITKNSECQKIVVKCKKKSQEKNSKIKTIKYKKKIRMIKTVITKNIQN